LVHDPELKHTNGEIPVCSFTLAVDRGYVKAGAERQADFIDVVCWRTTAEFVSKYFHKGQLVAVEGAIQTRTYTDSQGNKRKATEIVASKVDFAEPRRSSGEPAADTSGADELRKKAAEMGIPNISAGTQSFSQGDNSDFVEIDGGDDLPF
jgi:single-strand DNA-binding protein